MLDEYRQHQRARAAAGLVPKPLNADQVRALTDLLQNPLSADDEALLYDLLVNRVPPGVDEAAEVKASFLAAIAHGELTCARINKLQAITLLGTMAGGYNLPPLIAALDDNELASTAVTALANTLLIFDYFQPIADKATAKNPYAMQVLHAWAAGDWFLSRPAVAEKITLTVFKVAGETNTDDLSPAQDVWSRPDIPLHALTMLKNPREGIIADKPGEIGPMRQIASLKENGYPLAFVGDTVGTGSSRKSATNSLLWLMGEDIPWIPNKRRGGVVLAGKIAPIFFNTLQDAGALPIEADISSLQMGDIIDIYPIRGEIRAHHNDELLARFTLKTEGMLDEVRAGGRIALIIGRALTAKARQALNLPPSMLFHSPQTAVVSS